MIKTIKVIVADSSGKTSTYELGPVESRVIPHGISFRAPAFLGVGGAILQLTETGGPDPDQVDMFGGEESPADKTPCEHDWVMTEHDGEGCAKCDTTFSEYMRTREQS